MKTKTTIITALLLLAMVSSAVAQEKWDIASVQYFYMAKYFIAVSINGEQYEEYEVDKASSQGKYWGWDLNPVLKKLNEMQDKGWEIYSTDRDANVYSFHLRKKKN
jgi:hypothetical protein